MKTVKQTSFLALGIFLSGCSSHYLVTTKLIPNQKVSDDTEIVQSRTGQIQSQAKLNGSDKIMDA